MNEQARKQIYNIRKRDLTTFEKILCGGFSGLFSQSITYPLEVIRRRMQTIGVVSGKGTAVNVLSKSSSTAATATASITNDAARTITQHYSATVRPSMFQIGKDVIKEQGIMGFYKGLSMNWVKGPVSFSISFTTFDTMKEWIDKEEAKWIDNR